MQIQLPYDDSDSLRAFYGDPAESLLADFVCPPEFRYEGRLLVRHRCHRMLTERLETALQEISDTLGPARWMTEGWGEYAGCWSHRFRRGGSGLSTHAWGIAIDLAPGRNAWRSTSRSLSDRGIDIMEAYGFLSAGRAWGTDWMHFQAAKFRRINKGSYYDLRGYINGGCLP